MLTQTLEDIKAKYIETFKGSQYKDVTISVASNTKKADKENGASGSITIGVSKDGKRRGMTATLYIVETFKNPFVLFVNNSNGDVIFSNTSRDSIDKSEKYVIQFVSRIAENILAEPANK